MNATATATTPAQVGKGRTVHEVAAGEAKTLCGSTPTQLLTAEQAAEMGKACAKCVKIAAAKATEEAPADTPEVTPAVEEVAPEWRTLKGVGAKGAFQIHGDLHEVRGKLVFTPWGTAKQIKGERHTFIRQWAERGGYRYLEDAQGRRVEFSGGTATKVWLVDGVQVPAADVAEQAPADETPEAGDAQPTRGDLVTTVACPACHVGRGARCITRAGKPARHPHDARFDALEQAAGITQHRAAAPAWELSPGVDHQAEGALLAAYAARVNAPPAPAGVEVPAAEEAPAEVAELTEVEEVPEAGGAPAETAELTQVEEPERAPEADGDEAASAVLVQVSAYTAARQALRINGKDSEDTTLTLPAADLLETVAAMRRMPRWNAEQERLVINKVALIVASSAEGQRVWVRGEAAPIRVNFAGDPIAEDAPAEPGTVDMAAVLAATRVLRRRAEVRRVMDNRAAARAASA